MYSTVIIGYGHLGQYAQKFWDSNLVIHAVSKSLPQKSNPKIISHQIHLKQTSKLEEYKLLHSAIKAAPWINFWLPPSSSDDTKNIYLDVLKDVISLLRNDQLLTFISSTSIFGSKNRLIYENSIPDPETENAKLLISAEEYIKKNHKLYHIIRPAGLIDEIRHPINTLSGKKNLKDGASLVNLIHSEDVVRFIWHLKNHSYFRKKSLTTNICSYTHLSKEIFYARGAKARSLSVPEFLTPELSLLPQRKILSHHLWQNYLYQLKYLHVD